MASSQSPQSVSTSPDFYVSPAVQHLSMHLDTFLNSNTHIDRLAVGGLIFHSDTAANSPRLLLLQRSNSVRNFPRAWEIPGGQCELADETILHSISREVLEKTGMRVNNIVGQVGEIEYFNLKGVRWARMCFLIGVEEVTGHEAKENVRVRLARSEHRASVWASSSRIEEVEVMTEGQRQVMRDGFGAFEEWCNQGSQDMGERLVLLYL